MNIGITLTICAAILGIGPFLMVMVYKVVTATLRRLPVQRNVINDVLQKRSDDGIELLSWAVIGLCVVVQCTQLLDSSPDTVIYLGFLSGGGFLCFFLARMTKQGPLLRFLVYLGCTTKLAIMAMWTLHLVFPSLFQLTIVILSALYAMLMILWRPISEVVMRKLTGADSMVSESENRPRTEYEEKLEKMAEDGVAYITTTGTGIIVMWIWVNIMNESPTTLRWMSLLMLGSFWTLYGAQLIGRGVLFEVWVAAGTSMMLALHLTSLMHLIKPGYEPSILFFSFSLVTFCLKWDWVNTLAERIHEKVTKKD